MKKTITVLSVNEMKIIKQINLVIQNRNEIDITAGIILYEGEFSETYSSEDALDVNKHTAKPKVKCY